ncbi:MAG: type II toxin-antitoxin system RelE/ParE family toxin [Sphingobacteriaceae bacterium]|nr:type II toxin-antitoxin system RelE/ParE family toxin [Sphingobacteriaceae bacterium]
MALEIVWSPRAIKNFDSVIAYLERHWTEREVRNFVKQTLKTVSLVSEFPYLYKPLVGNETIREAVVTKHNVLIYRPDNDRLEILTIFDTRQHPEKKRL